MRLNNTLLGLVLAGATATLVPGCAASGRATIVAYENPPPPLREETVVYRPGHVWVHGNWYRDGGRWSWRSGRFVEERPGYVYVPGRWQRHNNSYVWIDGMWRAQGGIVIRRR